MARPRRIQAAGLLRHVICRGNGRMRIFLGDGDYRQFVSLLGDICEEFGVECWSYCVMPNHYHAALRPTLPNISEAMRHLNARYAQWWNKRHNRVGHVFQGRFKDQIVQREGYLLALLRYIARNPVRARLVEHPAEWRWSSYGGTAGSDTPPPFVCAATVLAQFGEGDQLLLRERFANYVLGEPGEESLEDRLRSNERVLGDGAFKKSVRAEPSALVGAQLDPAPEAGEHLVQPEASAANLLV